MGYLLELGIRTENEYFGDASRFIRFLLSRSTYEDVEAFIAEKSSPAYRRRLNRTLKRFFIFAQGHLQLDQNPFHQQEASNRKVVGS